MRRKGVTFLVFAAMTVLNGCFLAGGGGRGISGDGTPASKSEDALYERYPQIINLEHKLDRASTYFYFGEYALSEAAVLDLLESIADVRALIPDPDVCEHLDYLEDRGRCIEQRMQDNTLEHEAMCTITAAVDSIVRNTSVEDEITVEMNFKTKHWINYFQGSGRRHFAKWLTRSDALRDVVEPILVEVGVPRDLLYLAVIESGLNLDARSRMRAIGPWQFMAGTGKLFGLRINWWLDERKDIVASTYAAANYMKYLHELFGSWPLALAAYNAGEHRVAYAMMRQQTSNYWRLRLPAQTSWFVPKFMAALAIGRDPEAYGFEKPREDPLEFDLVEIERSTELRDIAAAAGCSVADVKSLNPHLKKWATPPEMVVEVKLPKGTGERCLTELAAMPQRKMVSYVQHRVKSGETLSHIAAAYEVSVEELKRVNEIKNARLLHAGNILLIPVKDTSRSVRIASRPSYRTPPQLPDDIGVPRLDSLPEDDGTMPDLGETDDTGYIVHVVRRGETLSAISKRYGASISEILALNQRISRNRIHPGDKIRIPAGSN
jgi:membrane-bound lytic murein transglycosylase D